MPDRGCFFPDRFAATAMLYCLQQSTRCCVNSVAANSFAGSCCENLQFWLQVAVKILQLFLKLLSISRIFCWNSVKILLLWKFCNFCWSIYLCKACNFYCKFMCKSCTFCCKLLCKSCNSYCKLLCISCNVCCKLLCKSFNLFASCCVFHVTFVAGCCVFRESFTRYCVFHLFIKNPHPQPRNSNRFR